MKRNLGIDRLWPAEGFKPMNPLSIVDSANSFGQYICQQEKTDI